jgi:hypothetical protein
MRSFKNVLLLAATGLILALSSTCLAWNSTDHEAIAQIAYDHLSPAAREKIIAVLKQHPRLHEDLLHDELRVKDDNVAMFLRAATWPDMVRYPTNPLTHTENHPQWHYVDFPYNTQGVTGEEPNLTWDGQSDPANLVQAMQKVTAELKDPATPGDRKAIDLCWVEHLVGDIHQPLHATSWFSQEFPTGDRGGNQVLIMDEKTKQVDNLHWYWDGEEGMSMDPQKIQEIVDRVEKEHPLDSMKSQVADLSVVDWAHESFELAKQVCYLNGTLPHAVREPGVTTLPSDAPPLPAGYDDTARKTADERTALAGYRLAAVLEEIAKSL